MIRAGGGRTPGGAGGGAGGKSAAADDGSNELVPLSLQVLTLLLPPFHEQLHASLPLPHTAAAPAASSPLLRPSLHAPAPRSGRLKGDPAGDLLLLLYYSQA